jgi:hypothetical protein
MGMKYQGFSTAEGRIHRPALTIYSHAIVFTDGKICASSKYACSTGIKSLLRTFLINARIEKESPLFFNFVRTYSP